MNRTRRGILTYLLAAGLALASASVSAEPDLLPPDQAFKMVARQGDDRSVEIDFRIAAGYYLYRDRFSFSTDNPSVKVASVALPPALSRFDPMLGRNVEFYTDRVTVRLRLSGPSVPVNLTAKAQGCAEIGLCYPPVSRTYSVPASPGARG